MTRSASRLLPVLLNILALCSCTTQAKYDSLQRTLDRTAEDLNKTQDALKKSQDQVAELHAHRYEIFPSGGRTWRLDTAQGSLCVLLASDQEWKEQKVKAQSCTCEDWLRDHDIANASPSELETWNVRLAAMGCD
jgi:hypothetical protein